MLDYIQCPECGNNIGAVYEAYNIIKKDRYKKEFEKRGDKTVVQNTGVIDDVQINMIDIFKQLHIHKYCCRTHMTTAMDFTEAQYI
jgi:DNA-directed RNA polymerase subunit N (RpoN/RPB10)